jgi:peptidoglycan/LPS O-acetylase OafA/YrhL
MPPLPPPHRDNRMPGLEALRGFAAICILLLHTRAVFGGVPVFGKGYLAVEFFLMLSGFLMAHVQEERLARDDAPLRFMAKRYRRLWPTMAIGGTLGLPRLFVRTSGLGQFASIALANLLLIPVAFKRELYPLNIPAWTIFYELLANLLHTLVLRHLKLWTICLGIALLAPVMVWIGLDWGSFDVGARPESVIAGLPRILFAYLIGVALGRWWGDTPLIPVPPLLAIPAMPAILAAGWWLGLGHWWFDFGFTIVACPLMIAGGLRLRCFQRLAELLGQLSFPLFAVQMPILQGMQMLGFGYWTGGLTALAGGIVAAFLTSLPGRWKHWREQANGQEQPA